MFVVLKLKIVLFFTFFPCFSVKENENKDEEVTLVTAYFDIGRESYKQTSRTTNKYFRYFEKWARMKNPLIVFCQSLSMKEKIMIVRKKFGLENKTKVVVKCDVFSVESEIYEKMVEISNNSIFKDFREDSLCPESHAEYNYIVFLKFYFLHVASTQYDVGENMAWIDFGFNHGGELYTHKEDFSFYLKCPLHDKISLFYLPPTVDERPMFEIIRKVHPCSIAGNFVVCPKSLTKVLWTKIREAAVDCLDVGLMDDDQGMLLLAYRRFPEIFVLKKSWWCLPLRQYCNAEHMRINFPFLWRFRNEKFYSTLRITEKKRIRKKGNELNKKKLRNKK